MTVATNVQITVNQSVRGEASRAAPSLDAHPLWPDLKGAWEQAHLPTPSLPGR
jgi:hypothetical protein